MSSHHFVKEGQEPALFVLDPLPFQLAGPLLEWAPLVLVSDYALEDVIRWGIKIDLVLAEENRVEMLMRRLQEQTPVKIVSHRSGESCIMNALDFVINNRQATVNIIASVSEDLFVQTEKCMHQLQVSLFDENWKWSAISTGNFEKWLAVGTNLQIRKSFKSQSIQFQGLTPKEGGFETITNGIINISSNRLFWVAEPHS
jgi:hypothetical protein